MAKFSMDEVKALDGPAIGDTNTFAMSGLTTDGDPFGGTQDVKVMDIISQGR